MKGTIPSAQNGRSLDLRGNILDDQQRLKNKVAYTQALGFLAGRATGGRGSICSKMNLKPTIWAVCASHGICPSIYTNLVGKIRLPSLIPELVEVDKQTLTHQFDSRYEQQLSDIEKNAKLIQKDDEIIKLRQGVTRASSSQLENGISTTTDYLTQLQNEIDARQQKALHEIQFETAKYNIKILTGN